MKRINWDLEEAVALYDLYFKSGQTLSIDKDKLKQLSEVLNRRARLKGWIVDDKFRNVTGLSMQVATIHYIVTGGKEGLKNSSKIFREVYDLYKEDPEKFDRMVKEFYLKYEWVKEVNGLIFYEVGVESIKVEYPDNKASYIL